MPARTENLPVAIITGAGGAVGTATAIDLAEDHVVYALARTPESTAHLQDMKNIRTRFLDLQNSVEVEQFAKKLNAELADSDAVVSALVHAAAIGPAESLEDCDAQLWQETLAVNVTAAALLTRGLLPTLREGEATVIFVNSGAGQRAFPDHTAYAASKHALRALADSTRLGEPKLRVTSLNPGQIDSKMLRGINRHLGRPFEREKYIQPVTIANTVRWIVEATRDVQITNIDVRPRHELA